MNHKASTTIVPPIVSTLEWILLLALFGFFAMRALLPGWRTLNTDFPNYYLTAVLRYNDSPTDRAYEWIWFQRQKDRQDISQPLVGFVPNPPLCAGPLLPLAKLAALSAKRVWILFNLALLTASLCILHRITRLRWRHILLIAGLCLAPLRANFVLGQYYVVILLLLCLAYYALVRGYHFTAGALLATAASFKLFPAMFLLLFLRKRDWRASAGLILGCLVLGGVSILIFGLDMHRAWLTEVLPRALRGDMVGPYDLQWSSFSSLWHHLFLFEPDLNPSPFFDSPVAYAVAQALTSTALLFSFLFATVRSGYEQNNAWEWAAFVALLLLLSSMPGSYHYVILIFTVVVGVDMLVESGNWQIALLLVFVYAIACANAPGGGLFFLRRLLATLALYIFLLCNAPGRAESRARRALWITACAVCVLAGTITLITMRGRDEDFVRRPEHVREGYASFNPIVTKRGIATIEMVDSGYRAVMLADGRTVPMPAPGDVLSIAASARSPFVYLELVGHRSHIMRLPSNQVGEPESLAEYVTDGQQPAISDDGRWLAFLREQRGRTAIWLSRDGRPPEAVKGWQNLPSVLEMSVTPEGNIVAALGGAADPHLILLSTTTGEAHALEIPGAVRYPAASPDSTRLAFSRREGGSWHLFVRDLSTGQERRLTSGACNATSPAWEGMDALLYATDCGRGFGMNAVARIKMNN